VMVECKEAFAQRPDIKFPQDLIKSVDPISILAMIGEKMPGPLKTAYSKALELAAFAPLMPIVNKLKDSDLDGATAALLSPGALQLFNSLNPEMPRNLFRFVFLSQAVRQAIELSMKHNAHLNVQFEELKRFATSLDDICLNASSDAVIEKYKEVVCSFKSSSYGFKFPSELMKNFDPCDVFHLVREKLPQGLIKNAFDQAIQLAEFKPLMPLIEKMKNKDLHGAVALILSLPVMTVCSRFDPKMPQTLLQKIFYDGSVKMAIQKTCERLPERIRSPVSILQTFMQEIDAGGDDLMEHFEDVLQNFEDYREVYRQPQVNFNFPNDLLQGVQPVELLKMIGEHVPAPVNYAFLKALSGCVSDGSINVPRLESTELRGAMEAEDTLLDPADITLEDTGGNGGERKEEKEEKKAPNFVEMIDKLLSKLNPGQFVKLIEKLHAALPPPGQAVLEPFIVILTQACEIKAAMIFERADSDGEGTLDFDEFCKVECNQGVSRDELRAIFDKLDVDKGGTLTKEEFQRWKDLDRPGAAIDEDKFVDEYNHAFAHRAHRDEFAHAGHDDVKIDVALPEDNKKKPLSISIIIMGIMALFGIITVSLVIAMAASPDCGCGSGCPAAQKVLVMLRCAFCTIYWFYAI